MGVELNLERKHKAKPPKFFGLTIGNEIFLVRSKPLDFLKNYWHEAGHIIGDELSFVNGDVLTPNEAKKTSLNLSRKEVFKAALILFRVNFPGQDSFSIDLANRILKVFTKGNFDINKIILHNKLTDEELKRLIDENDAEETSTINATGERILKSTRDGRNIEIPAFSTDIACRHILMNSLGLEQKAGFEKGKYPYESSHARAMNLVIQAYTHHGYVLPSMLDLINKNKKI